MSTNDDEQAVIDTLTEAKQPLAIFEIVHAIVPPLGRDVDGRSREARQCRERTIQLIRTVIGMWERAALIELVGPFGSKFALPPAELRR